MTHVPSARQQAPSSGTGQSTVAQEVPRPWKALGAVHCAATVRKQEPSGRQQAPKQVLAAPQGWLGLKTPPCCSQLSALVLMQVPSGRQQAPICTGQMVAVQLVPMPWKTPGRSQPWMDVMMQVPSGRQQAPRQAMVWQELPVPIHTPPTAAHSADTVMMQVPSVRQQAPRQMTSAQATPVPM